MKSKKRYTGSHVLVIPFILLLVMSFFTSPAMAQNDDCKKTIENISKQIFLIGHTLDSIEKRLKRLAENHEVYESALMHYMGADKSDSEEQKRLLRLQANLAKYKHQFIDYTEEEKKVLALIDKFIQLDEELDICLNKLKDSTKSKLPSKAGKFDSCLVGSWRSESVVRSSKFGGAGIIMTIKGDGSITINYTGMREVKQVILGRVVSTDSWSGTATGHIMTDNGLVNVSSVEKSGLTGKETDQYGTKTLSLSGLGPIFDGGGRTYQLRYTCNEKTLIIKVIIETHVLDTYTFKHEKREP